MVITLKSARSPVATVCRALGDETRLQILALLRVRELCGCELVDLLGISQPAISEHLRRLKDAGLVVDDRRGMWVCYRLAEPLPAVAAAALAAAEPPSELEARLRTMAPAAQSGRSR